MKCLKCIKKAEIKYPNGDVCRNCFLELLTNRIKKEIRKENPFQRNEKVLVYGELAGYFLKRAVEGLPLKINVVKTKYDEKTNDKYNKAVVPVTADDEAELFFNEIMNKKPIFRENNKIMKIFRPILDKELVQASKILKIPFKIKKRSKEYEKIRQRNPAAAFGLVKSKDDMEKS